jgi:hypothetical protein
VEELHLVRASSVAKVVHFTLISLMISPNMSWLMDLAQKRAAGEDAPALFGVILYTDRNAYVKKVLRDEDYWAALSSISGPRWAVFSVRARSGEWERVEIPQGGLGLFLPVWKEPEANRELLDLFELDDTRHLPALVIFLVEGKNVERVVCSIRESTVEETYNSIGSLCATVSAAIDRASAGGADPTFIFTTVKRSMQKDNAWQRLRQGYRVIKEIREWLPL